jgi:hypothetical protein
MFQSHVISWALTNSTTHTTTMLCSETLVRAEQNGTASDYATPSGSLLDRRRTSALRKDCDALLIGNAWPFSVTGRFVPSD